MKKDFKKLWFSSGLSVTFIIWTILIKTIDVKAIGPNNSSVGLATLNEWFYNLTGTHMLLYNITDWLGLVPIIVCLIFAVVGFVELIKRRSLIKVDADVLILGLYYILVIGCYLFFEIVAINYRPVLINGYLEASYPSSTTLLVLTVMPTAIIQCKLKIKNVKIRKTINIIANIYISFMVLGRLICGVHWISDVIGGVLLSCSLENYIVLVLITLNKFNNWFQQIKYDLISENKKN